MKVELIWFACAFYPLHGGRYSVAEEFVQLSEVSVIRDLRSAVDGQADHRDGNQDCFVTNS